MPSAVESQPSSGPNALNIVSVPRSHNSPSFWTSVSPWVQSVGTQKGSVFSLETPSSITMFMSQKRISIGPARRTLLIIVITSRPTVAWIIQQSIPINIAWSECKSNSPYWYIPIFAATISNWTISLIWQIGREGKSGTWV